MRKILKYILYALAKLTLAKYKPIVIGITGSFGKTSTKEAIALVLDNSFSVRANQGNLNTDIGVPLTIIGGIDVRRNIVLWVNNIFKALLAILFKNPDYPQVLVLEMASDKPGDIRYLRKLTKPKIGVITGIGKVPVHVAYFKSPEAVALEKYQLIKKIPESGFAILNEDNDFTRGFKEKTKAKVITYGFSDKAAVKISDYKLIQQEELSDSGISFRLEYQGNFLPVRIKNCVGITNAYALGAAASVGLSMGLNLVKISESLSAYKPPISRLNLIKGIKGSWVIDDSYNASPDSTLAALELLSEFQANRKIAILGDMLELGEYTEDSHRHIGKIINKYADIFFAIGSRMKFAYEEAEDNLMPKDKLCVFGNADEARIFVQNYIKPGDLILIKGSRGMKMEQIIDEIKAQ